jgi:serine/threonine protein phosphatase PrpC
MELFRRLFGRGTEERVEPGSQPLQSPLPAELENIVDVVPRAPAPSPPAGPQQTRPLAPPKEFTTQNQQIKFGAASDVGQVRSNNQDACLTLLSSAVVTGNPPPIGLFVVADGMGGHHDGELASAVTAQILAQYVVSDIILPQLQGHEPNAIQKTIPEVLTGAMNAANQAVQVQVPNGGTTGTCAVIRGDLAFIAHVGDSRAYLITDNNMELITRDHSLVRRLQELGQLTAEEAEVHPQRNVLYRALGQGETLEVDAATRRLPPSSTLLLCSDGLWGIVSDERINEILQTSSDPQEACDQMIIAANENGGPDNITVVIAQMPD